MPYPVTTTLRICAPELLFSYQGYIKYTRHARGGWAPGGKPGFRANTGRASDSTAMQKLMPGPRKCACLAGIYFLAAAVKTNSGWQRKRQNMPAPTQINQASLKTPHFKVPSRPRGGLRQHSCHYDTAQGMEAPGADQLCNASYFKVAVLPKRRFQAKPTLPSSALR